MRLAADGCDVDHLVPWPIGPTRVTNLDCLSRGCHNGKTARVWQVGRVEDDGISWTSLAGRDYITYPRDWREALRDPGSGPLRPRGHPHDTSRDVPADEPRRPRSDEPPPF